MIGGDQALTPISVFANAPRFRVRACFSFVTGEKLFDIEVIRHLGYTVLDFKKSVIQQLNIDPSLSLHGTDEYYSRANGWKIIKPYAPTGCDRTQLSMWK